MGIGHVVLHHIFSVTCANDRWNSCKKKNILLLCCYSMCNMRYLSFINVIIGLFESKIILAHNDVASL